MPRPPRKAHAAAVGAAACLQSSMATASPKISHSTVGTASTAVESIHYSRCLSAWILALLLPTYLGTSATTVRDRELVSLAVCLL